MIADHRHGAESNKTEQCCKKSGHTFTHHFIRWNLYIRFLAFSTETAAVCHQQAVIGADRRRIPGVVNIDQALNIVRN